MAGHPVGPTLEEVYETLKSMARRRMRGEPPRHTLQATALVNEIVIKFLQSLGDREVDVRSMVAQASSAMRNTLIDYARRSNRAKRGGGRTKVSLKLVDGDRRGTGGEIDLIELEELMSLLKDKHPRGAEILERRFFLGETLEAIGADLNLSRYELTIEFKAATNFLRAQMSRD